MMRLGWALVLGGMMAMAAAAAPSDHYTPADLAKIAEGLKTKAGEKGGMASTMLNQYDGHHTMLAYKRASGPGEIHTHYADIFVIVSGKATLLTEGSLPGAKEESPGELRAPAVEGGKTTLLAPGDAVHIPAGTPHQMLIQPGDEVVYYVVKIKEN